MRGQDHRRDVAATMAALFVVLLVGLMPAFARSAPPDASKQGEPADCGYGTQVRIIPATPNPNDPIQVIPSGDWYDSCVPTYQSHQIAGNVIRVNAAVEYPSDPGCADVITPWEIVVDVGTLPSGAYQVELYIARPESAPTLCATTSFQVYWWEYSVYLPLVRQGEYSVYLPLALRLYRDCVPAGEIPTEEEYARVAPCCPGLVKMIPAFSYHPCSPPGQGMCGSDGCSIPPP